MQFQKKTNLKYENKEKTNGVLNKSDKYYTKLNIEKQIAEKISLKYKDK